MCNLPAQSHNWGMFVGIREIFKAKGRFSLIVGTVGLITLLVVMLTGLTEGLGKQNTSALEALDPAAVQFQDMEEPSYVTSRVRVDAPDAPAPSAAAIPLGTGQTLLSREDGTEESIAVLGLPQGTTLPDGTTLGDVAIASESLGVAPGDELTVGGAPVTVGAIAPDLHYSHSLVLWVPTHTWREAMHTDADGTVFMLGEAHTGADAGMSLKESFSALPAYQSERSSFTMIQGFLYAIAALVIIAFLTVWTMQRTRDLAILKAIGASNSYLRKDALGQAAILLVVGAGLGTLIAYGIGLAAAQVAPFELTALSIAGPPVLIWVLGMAGALLATRQISNVEPQLALGGIA